MVLSWLYYTTTPYGHLYKKAKKDLNSLVWDSSEYIRIPYIATMPTGRKRVRLVKRTKGIFTDADIEDDSVSVDEHPLMDSKHVYQYGTAGDCYFGSIAYLYYDFTMNIN